MTAAAQAPEKKPAEGHFYKLQLILKETEAGKLLSSRTYNLAIGSAAPMNIANIDSGKEKLPKKGRK